MKSYSTVSDGLLIYMNIDRRKHIFEKSVAQVLV